MSEKNNDQEFQAILAELGDGWGDDAERLAYRVWQRAVEAAPTAAVPAVPVAWIATHESGRVLHLSRHDGWSVEPVVEAAHAPWSKPMGFVAYATPPVKAAPALTEKQSVHLSQAAELLHEYGAELDSTASTRKP